MVTSLIPSNRIQTALLSRLLRVGGPLKNWTNSTKFSLPERHLPFRKGTPQETSLSAEGWGKCMATSPASRAATAPFLQQKRHASTEAADGLALNHEEYTAAAFDALVRLVELAEDYGSPELDSPLLLRSLLDDKVESLAAKVLQKCNIEVMQTLLPQLEQHLRSAPSVSSSTGHIQRSMGTNLIRVLRRANSIRREWTDQFISVEHLLVSLAENDTAFFKPFLGKAGVDSAAISSAIQALRAGRRVASRTADAPAGSRSLDKYGVDLTVLASSGKLDPVIGREEAIRRIIQILSRRTKNNPVILGEPGTGKTAVVEGLAQRIISGDVPDDLKGRKVISLDLAALLAGAKFRGEFEERLKSVLKEVSESAGQIILFIDEIHSVVGAGSGGADSGLDAGNILKPMLARGELRCVGATTTSEYTRYIEKDKALERRLQKVLLTEPTRTESLAMLRGIKDKYETHHGIRICDSALVAAVDLSARYIGERYLPDKAIDLIDEAASRLKIQLGSKPVVLDRLDRQLRTLEMEKISLESDVERRGRTGPEEKKRLETISRQMEELREEQVRLTAAWEAEKAVIEEIQGVKTHLDELRLEQQRAERAYDLTKAAQLRYADIPELEKKVETLVEQAQHNENALLRDEVTAEDVAEVVSAWTGIQVTRLVAKEKERLLNLAERLSARVVGQPEAVMAVTNAVQRARAGLAGASRPLASLMFLGQTGVGKTELCKALAEQLFDSEDAIVRVDMSEYSEKHSVARMIGAPPGYIGFEQGGQLTEAVRRKPYAVVLFDEMEKAHPEIFNVLLQILEDGRLTDSKGVTVNFKNCIVIFTSNLGSETLGGSVITDRVKTEVMEYVRKSLRPEFVNRIDEFVIFNPLTSEHCQRIALLEIDKLKKRLIERRPPVEISIDPAVAEYIAKVGFDPLFGARPIRRQVRQVLENPLSMYLLSRDVVPGDKPCSLSLSLATGGPEPVKITEDV